MLQMTMNLTLVLLFVLSCSSFLSFLSVLSVPLSSGNHANTTLLGDTLNNNNRNGVTWRTDDNSDDDDDNNYRGGRSPRSPRNSSSSSWGRNSSRSNGRDEMGWKKELNFDASSRSLSDSYRIPRAGNGSGQWHSHGSSTRRDSLHDRDPKSRRGNSRNNNTFGSRQARGRGELGGGLSSTWSGSSGR